MTSQATQPSKNRTPILILVALLLLGYTALSYWLVTSFLLHKPFSLSPASKSVPGIPTPTPTPRPIPSGKKGFTVGQSDKTVPQFGRGFIDPYDPAKGARQTVTIAVKYTEPVRKVDAVVKTDHSVSKPTPLTLMSGTPTDGEWQGSWNITDTYLYTYALVLHAESSNSSGSVTVTLR